MAKKQQEPLITVRGDIKQKDVRNLELEVLQAGHNYLVAAVSSSYHEVMLKAAIGAGWVEHPPCRKEEKMVNKKRVVDYYFGDTLVDDLDPRVCYAAGDVIVELMVEYTSLDPNLLMPPSTSDSDAPA